MIFLLELDFLLNNLKDAPFYKFNIFLKIITSRFKPNQRMKKIYLYVRKAYHLKLPPNPRLSERLFIYIAYLPTQNLRCVEGNKN